MDITFDVIDLACQSADQSFFPPRVAVTTKSTTQIATILGYSEYIPSTPPKKYKKLAWSGVCKQTAKTFASAQNCCGAKYVWSGTAEIDSKGNQISKYQKNFFAECPKIGPWPTITSVPNFGLITMVGYCWAPDPDSCPSCDSNDANWVFVADVSDNQVDDTAQNGFNNFLLDISQRVSTSTSLDDSATGTQQVVAIGNVNNFPKSTLDGFTDNWVILTTTNTCKSQLSDEYTDAEALLNAQVIVSNGKTAENLIRTTGFISRFTGVVYTLSLSNLLPGSKYVVSVLFVDQSFVKSIRTYTVTATAATATVIDAIPQPLPGNTTTLVSATVAFAP